MNHITELPLFPHDDILPVSVCEEMNRILLDRIDRSLPLCAYAVVKVTNSTKSDHHTFVVFLYGFYGDKSAKETAYCRVWGHDGLSISEWWKGTLDEARGIWNDMRRESSQFERIL